MQVINLTTNHDFCEYSWPTHFEANIKLQKKKKTLHYNVKKKFLYLTTFTRNVYVCIIN